MPSNVAKFMTDKTRATERERILHLTAARDLKLYAASHGARLLITDPELDLDGYDFAMSSEFECCRRSGVGVHGSVSAAAKPA